MIKCDKIILISNLKKKKHEANCLEGYVVIDYDILLKTGNPVPLNVDLMGGCCPLIM